jgi:hypothetical protein
VAFQGAFTYAERHIEVLEQLAPRSASQGLTGMVNPSRPSVTDFADFDNDGWEAL